MTFGALVLFLLLVLWVFCVVDVITTSPTECRHLPKLAWLAVVVFLPDIGSILWLILGRRRGPERPDGQDDVGAPAKYDRPGRRVAANPDDDDAFLRSLRDRAEEQRRAAREQRRLEEE